MASLRAFSMAASIASFSLMLCASARAQEPAQAPSTFSDASGGMWGLASFELSLLLDGAFIGATDGCDDDEVCLLAALVASAFSGVSAGALAAVTHTPPDVPFTAHTGLWGGAGSGLLALGLWAAADGDSDGELPVALTFGTLGALGIGAYSVARRDALFRDGQTTAATHFMAWGPMTIGLLAAVLSAALDLDDEAAVILAGAAGLLSWGVAVAMVETSATR